jgi:hypothetical protein
MRHSRRASFTSLLFIVLLAFTASIAFAGECPLSTTGPGYAPGFASPIGLPRCGGTTAVPKWTPCEVCLLSNAFYNNEQDPYIASYPASGTGLQPRATFNQSGILQTVDGFFDGLTNVTNGQAIFRIRYSSTA